MIFVCHNCFLKCKHTAQTHSITDRVRLGANVLQICSDCMVISFREERHLCKDLTHNLMLALENLKKMLACSFIISLHMHHKETSNNVRTSWQWSRQMLLLCRMIWQGEVRNLTLRYTSKSKNHSTSYAHKLIFLMLGLICCLNNCTMLHGVWWRWELTLHEVYLRVMSSMMIN